MWNLVSSAGGVSAGAWTAGRAHPHFAAADSHQRHRGETETKRKELHTDCTVQNIDQRLMMQCWIYTGWLLVYQVPHLHFFYRRESSIHRNCQIKMTRSIVFLSVWSEMNLAAVVFVGMTTYFYKTLHHVSLMAHDWTPPAEDLDSLEPVYCSSSVRLSSLRVTAFVSTCQNSSIGGWWITWREPPSFSPPLLPLSTCSPQWHSRSHRPLSPSLTAIWWIPPSPRCLSASSPWWRIKPYVLDSTNIVTEKKIRPFVPVLIKP